MKWSDAVCVMVAVLCITAMVIVAIAEVNQTQRVAISNGYSNHTIQGWRK